MATPIKATALTAREFFDKGIKGFSKTDAEKATGLSYSAIHDSTIDGVRPRPATLAKLQRWSLAAVAEHGVYLSGEKTAPAVPAPTMRDLKAAG